MKLSLAFAAALFLPVLVDAHSHPILNRRATTEVPEEPTNPAPAPAPNPTPPAPPPNPTPSAPAPNPSPPAPAPNPSPPAPYPGVTSTPQAEPNPSPSAPAPPSVAPTSQAEPTKPASSASTPPGVASTSQAEPTKAATSAPAPPSIASTSQAEPTKAATSAPAPPSIASTSQAEPTKPAPSASTLPGVTSTSQEEPNPSTSASASPGVTSKAQASSVAPYVSSSTVTPSTPAPTVPAPTSQTTATTRDSSTALPSSTKPTSSSVMPELSSVSSSSSSSSSISSSSISSNKATTSSTSSRMTTTTTMKPTTTATTKASSTSTKGTPRPTTSTSSPRPTPTCPPTDTCVQVAPNGQMSYDPSNLGARNGTIVTFLFPLESTSNAISLIENSPNSVTQGSFDNPCVYLTASGGNPAGFDSGLQNGKLFSIRITNDQLPIYFFSKEQKFCGQGMVGTINAPATGGTADAYLAEAKALGPNQQPIPDTGPVVAGVGAQALGTPYPPGASPAPSATCASSDTCVQVSPNGQTIYDPPTFAASNGTVVTFVFPSGSGSNSVTEGEFENPCVYLTAAGGSSAGFDSGLQNGKLFSIKITNDQQPIYFFSKEEKVCGQGMVGAINPPATGKTYNAYLGAAVALGPNQNALTDTGPVLGGVGAVAQGTPSPIPTSSSSHLVPNSFFALLATAFGIMMA